MCCQLSDSGIHLQGNHFTAWKVSKEPNSAYHQKEQSQHDPPLYGL